MWESSREATARGKWGSTAAIPYKEGFNGPDFTGSSQVIAVTADDMTKSCGTLNAYERADGVWTPVFSAPVFLGKYGMVHDSQHREGDERTPAGVYGFRYAFGWLPDPGSAMRYILTDDRSYFDENAGSPTYNRMVEGDPGGNTEKMAIPPYRYGAVIDFNHKQVPYRGSGIFLHVRGSSSYTAACVSADFNQVVRILKWLDPAKRPRILICPRSDLAKYYC